MKFAILVLLLALASASVYSTSIVERDLELESEGMGMDEMEALLEQFVDGEEEGGLEGGDQCDLRKKKEKNVCKRINEHIIKCCKTEKFEKQPKEICIDMMYKKVGKIEKYEAKISMDGKSIYSGDKEIHKNYKNENFKKIKINIDEKITADMDLTISCQHDTDKEINGCLEVNLTYEKKMKKIMKEIKCKIGCYSIKKK